MAGARLFFRIGKKVSVFDYATLFDASYREDTLHADVVAHFAHGEALFSAFSRDADHNTAIQLDTLFVTFFDSVSDCDCVARAELRMLFAGSKSFFGNLN